MPLYAIGDIHPQVPEEGAYWIAPDARVIGRVHVGRDVSIWFGAVVRGDNEPITIGAGTNIQEHAMLHTDPGAPLAIGAGCTVGHRAILHGCSIGDNVLIGMGAIILNGATIGENSLVGAGALVTEGKAFPPNSLIVGSPARAVRTMDEAGVQKLRESARTYQRNWRRFAASLKPV